MEEKIKAYGLCLYKKTYHDTKILLCKSSNSKEKWGLLKGVEDKGESKKETATREFFEESSIEIKEYYLEKYFEQINPTKDIGIFLVNYDNIKGIEKYFENDKLLNKYLSLENTDVEFFNIKDLPPIKKKQIIMMDKILRYLK
jgi:ADP-ribose pyrophosphatase YjhB (NUDIX family)